MSRRKVTEISYLDRSVWTSAVYGTLTGGLGGDRNTEVNDTNRSPAAALDNVAFFAAFTFKIHLRPQELSLSPQDMSAVRGRLLAKNAVMKVNPGDLAIGAVDSWAIVPNGGLAMAPAHWVSAHRSSTSAQPLPAKLEVIRERNARHAGVEPEPSQATCALQPTQRTTDVTVLL